jgi:hypothetical protein
MGMMPRREEDARPAQKVLPKSDVEQSAQEQLTAIVGQASESIACPRDMKAKQ